MGPFSLRRPHSRLLRAATVVSAGLGVLLGAPPSARAEFYEGEGTSYNLGRTDAGNCNMMHANADAGTQYAALNDQQWENLRHCGRCAEVACVDARCPDPSKTQVVQLLDRCPECKHGDLDLSPSVFTALTGSHPSRFKIRWRFVDCPVQGNIQYCLKGGSNPFWTAVQPTNVISGVTSLKINGQETKMLGSAYYYLLDGQSQSQTDLSSVRVTLTSVNGETVQDTVSLTAGSCTPGSSQFARGGGGGGTGPRPNPPPAPVPAPSPVPTTTAPPPPSSPAPTTTAPPPPPPATVAPPTPTPTPTPTPAPTPTPEPSPSTETPMDSTPHQKPESVSLPPPTTAAPVATTPLTPPAPVPLATPEPTTSTPSPVPLPTTSIPPQPQSPSNNSSQPAQVEDRTLDNDQPTVAPVATTTVTPTTTKPLTTKGPSVPTATSTTAPPPAKTSDVGIDGGATPTGGNNDGATKIVNKTDGNATSTSPMVIALTVGGAFAVVVLLVVIVIVRKKKIDDKRRDEAFSEQALVQRVFESMTTPTQRRGNDLAVL